MNFQEYCALAMRTAKQMPRNAALVHGAMGIASDGGEIITHLKTITVYNKPLNPVIRDGICEEIGDTLWFVIYLAEAIRIRPMDLMPPRIIPPISTERAALEIAVVSGAINEWVQQEVFDAGGSPKAFGVIRNKLSVLIGLLDCVAEKTGLSLWDEIAPYNIRKLMVRYPDVYSDKAAQDRADKVEVKS